MSTVEKIYQLYDEASDSWFDVYKAGSVDGGGAVEVAVPRADRSVNAVRRVLLSKGVDAAVTETAILVAIGMEAPCVTRAAKAGWRENEMAFVLSKHVSSTSENGKLVLPPNANAFTANICTKGTLDGWQAFAHIAAHSRIGLVALGSVFAAPLIKWSGRPSFSIMFFGPSRCGKTSMMWLAASAIGYPHKNKMFNCNSTDAGKLAAAYTLSDHMIPMDEAGTTQGSKKETYAAIRNASYALCGGRDKTRHPAFQGAAVDATFNTIVLFTSERSPDAWAALDREQRDEGECARLIALPAVDGDHATVFDRAPCELRGEHLHAWERRQFALLNDGAPLHCGVAFGCFTDRLVSYPAQAKHLMHQEMARFTAATSRPGMSPVAQDIVASFSLIYAGLYLAIGAEAVTGVSFHQAFQGIQSAALAAVEVLPDPDADLKSDIALLRSKLEGGSLLSAEDVRCKNQHRLRQADGYVGFEEGSPKYYVRNEVFISWFASPLRVERILQWLQREGFLVASKDTGRDSTGSWAWKQVVWPDKTRLRSIIILLPNGLEDLVF